jgi:hypothetical protein
MTNYDATDRPPILTSAEIQKLFSMRLIANLATIDDDRVIHLVPMWFLMVADDICIPTRNTHKYRNLRKRPCASVMIDVSRAGLNLKGMLIRGRGTAPPQTTRPFSDRKHLFVPDCIACSYWRSWLLLLFVCD